MISKKKICLVVHMSIMCLFLNSVDAQVPLYGIFEQSFHASSLYTYTSAPIFKVIFEGVTGKAEGIQVTVCGFWDGGSRFKLRFSPRFEGTWKYTTHSQDGGLNNINGKFLCAGRLATGNISFHGQIVNSSYRIGYNQNNSKKEVLESGNVNNVEVADFLTGE